MTVKTTRFTLKKVSAIVPDHDYLLIYQLIGSSVIKKKQTHKYKLYTILYKEILDIVHSKRNVLNPKNKCIVQ